MRVSVPEVNIQRGGLTAISVGQVGIGPIQVGELVLDNADLTMSAGQAVLQDVEVTVTLTVTLSWSLHIPLPWPFDDINEGDTYTFTTPPYRRTIGDVTIPALNDVRIQVPSLTAANASATVDPLTGLQLGSAIADQIGVRQVSVPAQDFTIVGLALDSVRGTATSVPSANVGTVTVDRVRGDPVRVGELALGGLALPAASIPDITSRAPLDIQTDLEPQDIFRIQPGPLTLTLQVTPSANSHVERLRITNANATASVGRIVVRNVVLPYEVLNLTLSQLGIESVEVPTFTVS